MSDLANLAHGASGYLSQTRRDATSLTSLPNLAKLDSKERQVTQKGDEFRA